MGTEVGTTSFFYPPGMCSDDGLSGDLCLCQSAQKLVFQIWMVRDLGGIEGSWIFASFWKQTGVWDVFFSGGLESCHLDPFGGLLYFFCLNGKCYN